jgi:hypothetical protein
MFRSGNGATRNLSEQILKTERRRLTAGAQGTAVRLSISPGAVPLTEDL